MPSKRGLSMAKSSSKKVKRQQAKRNTPLPVTLLSGFLGSGKTSLLQHILKSDHGLRIAVIVNDIGAVNVDASLIKGNPRITRTDEKVVALQNGCICCTLRQDLLSELVELSEKHAFDYVIIESSGISEPAQVAESFDAKLSEHMYQMLKDMGQEDEKGALKKLHEAGEAGLSKFARLDTTVTLIDAFTIHNDFSTTDLLADRRKDVTPEGDERTVSDLMVDQIEFADVIVLNKTDMVSAKALKKTKDLVRALNREAKIIESNYGNIDISQVVGTGLFSLEKAQTGAGWMQDLHDLMLREINGKSVLTPNPETEEYNVNNFVYKRQRPFHPERLWKLVYDKFILQLEHPDGEVDEEQSKEDRPEIGENMEDDDREVPPGEEWEDEDTDMDSGIGSAISETSSRMHKLESAMPFPMSAKQIQETDTYSEADEDDSLTTPPKEIALQNKRQHALFKRLFRSKGTFWMATRPDYRGIWSQAGAMLTMLGGSRWDCTLDAKELLALYPPSISKDIMRQVEHDIKGGGQWGDRRQEIVFIGERLDKKAIEAVLDECLVTDKEWSICETVMKQIAKKQAQLKKLVASLEDAKERLTDSFEDAFPEWDGHFQDEEEPADDGDDDHDHPHV